MAGHIRKRNGPQGTKYQARIPSPLNPRKDIVKTFGLKRDAEQWLASQAVSPTLSTTATFADLTKQWRLTRAQNLAPKTLNRYEGIIKNYLTPAFGRTKLAALRRAAIKSYFAQLDATPATKRRVQVVLSSILSEAVELDLMRENPAARLRLPSPKRHDMTLLTASEVRDLAEAMPTPTDRLATYMAAYTGLRQASFGRYSVSTSTLRG